MKTFTLGQWTLQPDLNIIKSETSSLQLEPLTVKMLVFMTQRLGEAITRKELMDHIWGSTVVSNDSLNRIASQLRKIFDQDENVQLDTIRGVGYRLSVTSAHTKSRSEKGNKMAIWGITALLSVIVIGLAIIAFQIGEEKPSSVPELSEFTQLPGFLLNPSMSPDDRVMAFSWNGGEGTTFNIYLKQQDAATPVKFSEGSFDLAPVWSPEGDFIAYNSYNFMEATSTLVIKALVGGSTRTVEGLGSMNGTTPIDWSSDNETIVISANPLGSRRSVLHLIDLKDLSRSELTEVSGDTISHILPRFSPDNQKIAFVKLNAQVNDLSPTLHSKHDLMLLDLATGRQTLLIKDLPSPFGLKWLDAESLVYVNRKNGRSQVVKYTLENDSRQVIFSSTNVSLKGFGLFNKTRKLIVEAQRSDFNIERVVLGDSSLESKTSLINFTSSDLSPALNSLGQLVFISDYSGKEQLWMLEKGSKTPSQITFFEQSSTLSNPSWSSDGKEIIFSTKQTSSPLRIEKIRSDGTRHKILVEGQFNYDNPSWSMDGQSIYFYSDSLQVPQIFNMDLNTQIKQQITFNEGLYGRETELGFMFVKFNTAGIWRLNENRGEERIVEELSYFGLSDWQLKGDTLIYLRTRNNDPALVFYDMEQKTVIREVALPDLKMPVPSLGIAFDLDNNEIYITSSTELTSALNTLSW